jgi:hypothetical protein
MSAGLIHRALHAQSKARLFFDTQRSATRVGESFRRDIHDAQSAAVEGEAESGNALLRLTLAGGQVIEYRQDAGRVERLWLVEDAVRARESFNFSAETRLQAERLSQRVIALSAIPLAAEAGPEQRPLPSYTVPVSFRVEAVLGRNASLVDTPEQQP